MVMKSSYKIHNLIFIFTKYLHSVWLKSLKLKSKSRSVYTEKTVTELSNVTCFITKSKYYLEQVKFTWFYEKFVQCIYN